ncbi:hypothetical protein HDU83_006740 [Entophlyctis luteolus]|nr:hypothetical protein HDU83_006740 [Entophlyctis luteolus]
MTPEFDYNLCSAYLDQEINDAHKDQREQRNKANYGNLNGGFEPEVACKLDVVVLQDDVESSKGHSGVGGQHNDGPVTQKQGSSGGECETLHCRNCVQDDVRGEDDAAKTGIAEGDGNLGAVAEGPVTTVARHDEGGHENDGDEGGG